MDLMPVLRTSLLLAYNLGQQVLICPNHEKISVASVRHTFLIHACGSESESPSAFQEVGDFQLLAFSAPYMNSENVVTPLPKLHDKLHDPALVVMRLIIVQQNYNTLVP